jgi:hypothetical protein
MVFANDAHSGAIATQWPHQDVENWSSAKSQLKDGNGRFTSN